MSDAIISVKDLSITFGDGSTYATTTGQSLVHTYQRAGKMCISVFVSSNALRSVTGSGTNGCIMFGAAYTALAPTRILDTRNAIGVPGTTPPAAGNTITLKVAGLGGVPVGAKAAVLNVTATEAPGEGYVTVYPCDQARPNASNLNPVPGRAVANHVMVKLSPAGTVCLFTSIRVNLIADVSGSFT